MEALRRRARRSTATAASSGVAGPAAHFRTSVHALAALRRGRARRWRGTPDSTPSSTSAPARRAADALHDLDPALQLVGVDVAERPAGLAADVAWTRHVPDDADGTARRERVARQRARRRRWSCTDDGAAAGAGRPGDRCRADRRRRPDAADQDWLDRWWPLDAAEVGDRAEVGRPARRGLGSGGRLARAVASPSRSTTRTAATAGRRRGTLTGYRDGRPVPPVPGRSLRHHQPRRARRLRGRGPGGRRDRTVADHPASGPARARRTPVDRPRRAGPHRPGRLPRALSRDRRGGRADRPRRARRLRLAGAGASASALPQLLTGTDS